MGELMSGKSSSMTDVLKEAQELNLLVCLVQTKNEGWVHC
jgi:hypothetical protein